MISAFDCHSFANLSYYLYQEIQVPSYRKASVDRNIRQKALSRRPSTASLHAKPNTVQEKIFKIEKLPSTQNLVDSNDPLKLINKAVDVSTPKTRFSSQDRCKESTRSCSSPRLKYFPAEKIKKLESPPPFSPKPIGALIAQQDPRECGIVYVAGHPEQCRDTGQGDATAATQHVHEHRQPQVSRYFINFYFFLSSFINFFIQEPIDESEVILLHLKLLIVRISYYENVLLTLPFSF